LRVLRGFVVVLLTPEDVAEILALNVVTIRRMCARGDLPARKIAGKWRIGQYDLKAWMSGTPDREPDPGVMTPSRGRVKPRAEDPFHRAITGGRP
jgi:excisionase family DNA binding protein